MTVFNILVQTSAVQTSAVQTSAASASTQKFFGACLGDKNFFNGHKQDPPENSHCLGSLKEATCKPAAQCKKPASLRAFCRDTVLAYLCSGSPTWTRTRDLRINSPSLYQLSYQGSEAIL
jgi:hypothetical protein